MISQIAEAIISHYNGNEELKNVLTGGLWFTKAAQENAMPYAVFHFIGSTPVQIMGDKDDILHTVDLQISFFTDDDNGSFEIASMASRFDTAFNWEALDVSDYTCVGAYNDGTQPVIFVDEVWQTVLLYKLEIIKE